MPNEEQTYTTEEFNALPLAVRIRIKATGKLTKHFRGLESSNLLSKEQAAEYIGYVKDLARLAEEATPSA